MVMYETEKNALRPHLRRGDYTEAARRLNEAGTPAGRKHVENFITGRVEAGRYAAEILAVLAEIAAERAAALRRATQSIQQL